MKSFCVDWYTSYGFRLFVAFIVQGGVEERMRGGVCAERDSTMRAHIYTYIHIHPSVLSFGHAGIQNHTPTYTALEPFLLDHTYLMWMNLASGKSSCRSFSRAVCAGDLRISRCQVCHVSRSIKKGELVIDSGGC